MNFWPNVLLLHIVLCLLMYDNRAMELFTRKFPQHINLKKEDGFTPLHLCAFNDHLDTITSLLELVGANNSMQCTYTYYTKLIVYATFIFILP